MGFALEGAASLHTLPVHPSPSIAPEPAAAGTAALAHMVAQIMRRRPQSGAHALRELRAAFPDAPFAMRVAALDMLLRHWRGEAGPTL